MKKLLVILNAILLIPATKMYNSNPADSVYNVPVSEEIKCVDLNTSPVYELVKLPGIGNSKAEEIIKFRRENIVDDANVTNIKGIGSATFEKIKPYLC